MEGMELVQNPRGTRSMKIVDDLVQRRLVRRSALAIRRFLTRRAHTAIRRT